MSNTQSFSGASDLLEILFQPPPDRRYITRVAPLMAEVLGAMRAMPLPSWGLGELPERLDSMIELCRIIERGEAGIPIAWRGVQDFTRGSFITEHPVYAALEDMSKRTDYSSARVVLAAHIIVSVYAGRPKLTETGDVKSIPETNVLAACREIRLLPSKVLERFGDVPHDRDTFYVDLEAFIKACPENVSQSMLGRFRNVRRVIGLTKGIEHPENRTRGAGGARLLVEVSWREDASIIDSDDGLREERALSIPAFNRSDDKTLHDSVNEGLSASDVISAHTVRYLNTRYSLKHGLSPEHGLHRQRAVLNQVKRRSQLLPGRWEQLNELDIVVFTEWIEQATDMSALALVISFVTGRTLDVVIKSRLYGRDAQVPMSHSDTHISLSLESRTWISQPPMPERKRSMRANWHQNLVTTTENLVLPMPDLLWSVLTRYLGASPEHWLGNLFTKSQQASLVSRATEALRDGTKRPDVGLTVTRIQRHLFNILVSNGGDVADAVLITGVMPPYGQASSVYYYNSGCDHIESVYLDALARIPGLQKRAGERMRQGHIRDNSVGSPFCPRRERLPVMVSDLKAALRQQKLMPPSRQSLADFHNSYVVYTMFFVAFATGYRSVKFPISRESDIDRESGFLVIADKVGDDMSHSRLVPLAPVVLKHLSHYQRHRDALIRRLWGLNKQEAPEHFLFFLNRRNNTVTQITPSTIRYHSQWVVDLPLNINRHFLRSELRARGVPGELVDVFMGHWSNGQEPHGKFSSFSYRDYRLQIVPVVAQILAEMGWEPLEGRP